MNRLHTTVVAALLAVAVVLGGVAVLKTTGLGASAQSASTAAVVAKEKQLAAYQRSLRSALAARTPSLPKAPARSAVRGQAAQERVVYHRPPPIVVVTHARHGDDGSEEGGGDD